MFSVWLLCLLLVSTVRGYIMTDYRHSFINFINNDQNRPPYWCPCYEHKATANVQDDLKEFVEHICLENERYLGNHKQVLGLMSLIMTKVLNEKPLNPRQYIKKLLSSSKLKFLLNNFMLKNGYKKNLCQANHELNFIESHAKNLIKIRFEGLHLPETAEGAPGLRDYVGLTHGITLPPMVHRKSHMWKANSVDTVPGEDAHISVSALRMLFNK